METMSKNLIEITNKEQLNEILSSNQNVIVDYWAPWCAPCRQIAPVLDMLANEMTGKVIICKVNVDENATLSVENSISTIPTLLYYKDNKKVDMQKGFMGKNQMLTIIKTNFGI